MSLPWLVIMVHISREKIVIAEVKTMKNNEEMFSLMEALLPLLLVAIIHCPGHQKGISEIA